ncbi:hypothetical protein GOODEAATRI_031974 [Goodea atripinnis]|uniref:Uncharacterized protein n=1 Tax=Goodea atripinnis TaxID=208336 RepID=A0ABV0PTC5_9TELE
MRGLYEHTWQHHLAEVENCKVRSDRRSVQMFQLCQVRSFELHRGAGLKGSLNARIFFFEQTWKVSESNFQTKPNLMKRFVKISKKIICLSVFLKVALLALQLSDQQVKEIIASQLLPLIGQLQRQDEERLAALDVCHTNLAEGSFLQSRLAVS